MIPDTHMARGSDRTDPSGGRAAADGGSRERSEKTRWRLPGAATWATVLAGCTSDEDENTATTRGTERTQEPRPENYVVTVETGSGSVGTPEVVSFISACSPTSTFLPGMETVFYVSIYDPETGDQLTPDDLDAVSVSICDETVELSWHDGDDRKNRSNGPAWIGSWIIQQDIEQGEYEYVIEVTDEDANVRNVGVLANTLEIADYDSPRNYVVTTETVWNDHPISGNIKEIDVPPASEREFGAEMHIDFVVGIYDRTTGKPVGNDELDVVTVVSDDRSFEDVRLEWSGIGEPQWTGTLETGDLEVGTYGYEVTITDSDRSRIGVEIASAEFTIIEVPE